ncbi:hypothetical protein G7066_05230 [Leucobacter coleopterorum]|uniref:Uncharacterized protein n=1 Tax=Leucobacter coleopterorum TaxID=2714933 RepID=A0ABX6JV87_9MICO|nr:DUF6350 family protein [Leucobacter coleopterorum]QIM18208.1 hypothetical protein G7066_05230 [Leucobacter coleopterorum]
MRPMLTAVVAAIEALAVAIAGVAIVAVPALLLWAVTFGLAAEPGDVATNISAVWLLGHFVPLTFSLTQEAAVSFGLAAAPLKFTLSLAPLGVTLITALLAMRSGWRFGRRGGTGVAGVVGGALGFALAASLVVPFAHGRIVWSAGLAIFVAALVYGCASGAAFVVRAARDEHDWWLVILRWKQQGLDRLGVPAAGALPARLAEVVRIAAALIAGVMGIAGIALTVAIIAGYVSITTLSQNLQLDGVGAFLLFLLQLAYLPTMLIWGVSWVSGAGFAVGAGSSASPFGALLGPMPALPMFGAIPQGWGSAGLIAPLLFVLVGVGIGVLFASRDEIRRASWVVGLILPVAAAVLVGLAVTALASFATGSIGPDRLVTVGPEPWLVGGLVALELGVGAVVGVAARKTDYSRLRAMLPELSDASDRLPGIGANQTDHIEAGHLGEHETVELGEVGEMRGVRSVVTLPESERSDNEGAASEPFETGAFETESFETEPYDIETPPRDPELYDQETHAPDSEPALAETVGSGPVSAEDMETEELLRAYSWDAVDAAESEEPKDHHRGWRWPGKEH